MDSLDEVFELLTPERRRYVLYYLEQRDGPVEIKALAAKIQEWESDSSPSELPDDDYHDIVITLKHRHLPKAAQVEYIEYDPDASTIELTGSPMEMRAILSVARAIEQPQSDDIINQI